MKITTTDSKEVICTIHSWDTSGMICLKCGYRRAIKSSYDEFAAEDREMAEMGLGDYTRQLAREDMEK
jgi:hypothetical protein